MSSEKPGRQPYSSPPRSRQQEATRRLILEAVAGLVMEGRIHTFSVQDVADRAGISYASVYRHFPTREALLEAVYEWSSEAARSQMPPFPRTLDEIPTWVESLIPVFEQHAAVGQAMMVIMSALNIRPASQQQRDRAIEDLVAEGVPHLSP